MFRNILFATELKERSEEVLSCLVSLPASLVGKVTLLHVLDERRNGHPLPGESEAVLESQEARLLERGFSVERLVRKGVPFDVIVHEAQVREATLTAIGRGDSPRWKTRVMGETVLRVMELSPAPVLACSGKTGRPLLEDVVVGVDFSNEAHHALQETKKLAAAARGIFRKATLLHVHEQKNIDLLLKLVSLEQVEQIVAIERERLEEMVRGLEETGIPEVSVRMRTGKPVDEILADIGENRPSLVVLGAQGQGRSEMYRIGTTAFRVAQMAACPTLVFPLQRPALPF